MLSEKQAWLSEAADNQPLSTEQLDSLLQDPALQQKWLRYQLAGSAMRQELPVQLDIGFADRFENVLAAEGSHQLSVNDIPALVAQPPIQVQSAPAANREWYKVWWQSAIAASVAVVAVLGVQQMQQPQDALTSPLPVLQTHPIGGVATPVSLSQTSVQSRFDPQQQQLQVEQQRRIQALLETRQQQIRLLEQTQQQQTESPQTVEPKSEQ